MSLRGLDEQIAYERFTFDVVDACRAAGVEPPCDLAMRWYRGEKLADIVNERRVASGMMIEATAARQERAGSVLADHGAEASATPDAEQRSQIYETAIRKAAR